MFDEIMADYDRVEEKHGAIVGYTVIWIHRDGVSASAGAEASDPGAVALAQEFIDEFNNPDGELLQ
jgi:hypothetical protein